MEKWQAKISSMNLSFFRGICTHIFFCFIENDLRRNGRAVECGGLENR